MEEILETNINIKYFISP